MDNSNGTDRPKIVICVGSSCFARGNEKNVELAEDFFAARGLKDEVDFELSGCLCTGNCASGPVVIANGKTYVQVDQGVMRDILEEMFPRAAGGGSGGEA